MTGPEKRVLSGYSALSVRRTLEPNESETVSGLNQDKLQLANLAANLDILVNLCENVTKELTSLFNPINSFHSLHFFIRKFVKMIENYLAIKTK